MLMYFSLLITRHVVYCLFFDVLYMGTYSNAVGKLLYDYLINLMMILRSFVLVPSECLHYCPLVLSSFFCSSD